MSANWEWFYWAQNIKIVYLNSSETRSKNMATWFDDMTNMLIIMARIDSETNRDPKNLFKFKHEV